jgi:hypothetical protein
MVVPSKKKEVILGGNAHALRNTWNLLRGIEVNMPERCCDKLVLAS